MSTEENLSSSIPKWTLWILLVTLSVLPLINNMNDIMAKLAMTTGLNIYLKRNVVPTMTSTISILLRHVFQIENIAVGSSVFVKAHEVYHELYIGWNCVGWQSLILLLFSIVTSLAGDWSLKSKLKCSIMGLEGIIAINIARILAIAMVLIKYGPGTAVLFHDNLSQVLTFMWLGLFWYLSNEFILEPNWEGATNMQTMRKWLQFSLPDFKGKRRFGTVTIMILISSITLGGFVFYAGLAADTDNWWDSDWQYRKLVTQYHTQIDDSLTNFPMLISGTYTDLIGNTQTYGEDIAFISYDNTTQLDHEIEYYNCGTGELIAWVKTSLSHTEDTKFWMYYKNPSCPAQWNPMGVWGMNYRMVQHLKETSGTHQDSTMWNFDGTPQGGLTQNVAGKIDGVDQFDGSDDYMNCGMWSLTSSGQITVEAWAKISSTARNTIIDQSTDSSDGNGLHLRVGASNLDTKVRFFTGDINAGTNMVTTADGLINTGEWTYIAAKNDGTNMKVYINGEEKGSALSSGIITSASTAVLCGDAPIYSADFKFNGQMDEIRICDVARTDAWIVATYKTTHLPSSFYSCADQIEISENLSNLLLPALILPVFIGFVVRRKRK